MADFWEGYRQILEEHILNADITQTEEIRKTIGAFSTYLAVADPAYAYNSSFLQVKFDLYERFCRFARDRYWILQRADDHNLLIDLRRKFSADELTLTDGMWEIRVTSKTDSPVFHLTREFWREKIKPRPQPEESRYYLEWGKAHEQHCFVVSGKQAKEGAFANAEIYKDYSWGCNQLVQKLKEAWDSYERETPRETV